MAHTRAAATIFNSTTTCYIGMFVFSDWLLQGKHDFLRPLKEDEFFLQGLAQWLDGEEDITQCSPTKDGETVTQKLIGSWSQGPKIERKWVLEVEKRDFPPLFGCSNLNGKKWTQKEINRK